MGTVEIYGVDLNGLCNILQSLRAKCPIRERQLSIDLVEGLTGDADTAGLRDSFEARCDVHAVAVDVAAIDDDVAEMQAHSKQHPAVIPHAAIAYVHLPLDLRRTFHRFDHTSELGQDAVAHELHDSTAMPLDRGCNQFGPVGLKRGKRAGFICAHEAAVAGDVGSKDRDQLTSHRALPQPGPPHSDPTSSRRSMTTSWTRKPYRYTAATEKLFATLAAHATN